MTKNIQSGDHVSWGAGWSSRKQIPRIFIPALICLGILIIIFVTVTHTTRPDRILEITGMILVAGGLGSFWYWHVSRRCITITDNSVMVTDRFSSPIHLAEIRLVIWNEADQYFEWRRYPNLGRLIVVKKNGKRKQLPAVFAVGAEDRKAVVAFLEYEFGKRGIEVKVE